MSCACVDAYWYLTPLLPLSSLDVSAVLACQPLLKLPTKRGKRKKEEWNNLRAQFLQFLFLHFVSDCIECSGKPWLCCITNSLELKPLVSYNYSKHSLDQGFICFSVCGYTCSGYYIVLCSHLLNWSKWAIIISWVHLYCVKILFWFDLAHNTWQDEVKILCCTYNWNTSVSQISLIHWFDWLLITFTLKTIYKTICAVQGKRHLNSAGCSEFDCPAPSFTVFPLRSSADKTWPHSKPVSEMILSRQVWKTNKVCKAQTQKESLRDICACLTFNARLVLHVIDPSFRYSSICTHLSKHTHSDTAADLPYADGVMYKALCEIEDGIRGQRVILSEQDTQ